MARNDKPDREEMIRQSIEAAITWQNTRVVNADQMKERLALYWTSCANRGELTSFEGICVLLGITVEEGKRWCKGDGCDKEMRGIMQNALATLEAIDIDLVTRGVLPQGTYVWRSKQYYSMREPTVLHDLAATSPLRNLPSMSEIERKYLGDLPETAALPTAESAEGQTEEEETAE